MKKIRPIIKWTGGKYDEFSVFSSYLPKFEKYYEPFFGGGGVFFALQHQGQAFLNDKSKDLINFYQLLNAPQFKEELIGYANAWDEITVLAKKNIPALLPLYKNFIAGLIEFDAFSKTAGQFLTAEFENNKTILFDKKFIIYPKKLFAKLLASVADKGKRLKRIVLQRGQIFDDAELAAHIETAFKSGFYLFLRDLTNLQFAATLQMAHEKAVANWYFVREFCYASMFRFSKKGNFNIPYGGIAYNKKNFRQKVENIFSHDVKRLFANANFYNLDFAEFLNITKPTENDFIFLDPPYDSEFSEYDQNVFGKADQERLRDTLFKTSAKWMMVIKETDFIRSLYSSQKCTFIRFDKTYTYNVRGRNNRDTKHLIIINY